MEKLEWILISCLLVHLFNKPCISGNCSKHIRNFFYEFCRNIVWLRSFSRVQFFNLSIMVLVISLKLKLDFIFSICLLMALILEWCLYFCITDVTKFASIRFIYVLFCVLIPKFETISTKNSSKVVARFSSDVIIVNFPIRGIVLQVLTLFLEIGCTVF